MAGGPNVNLFKTEAFENRKGSFRKCKNDQFRPKKEVMRKDMHSSAPSTSCDNDKCADCVESRACTASICSTGH